MRRLTRLTLAFSKKLENFEAAVGLHFAYYNFVKRHSTCAALRRWRRVLTTDFGPWADLVRRRHEPHQGIARSDSTPARCRIEALSSVPSQRGISGETVWEGVVEVFDLIGHPKARRHMRGHMIQMTPKHPKRHVTVLHIPPVTSPVTGGRAAIVQEFRGNAPAEA